MIEVQYIKTAKIINISIFKNQEERTKWITRRQA